MPTHSSNTQFRTRREAHIGPLRCLKGVTKRCNQNAMMSWLTTWFFRKQKPKRWTQYWPYQGVFDVHYNRLKFVEKCCRIKKHFCKERWEIKRIICLSKWYLMITLSLKVMCLKGSKSQRFGFISMVIMKVMPFSFSFSFSFFDIQFLNHRGCVCYSHAIYNKSSR